jgi:parallel beta-helix repeat protein
MSFSRTTVLCGFLSNFAMAATLCVNPAGTSGCYATIGAAVTAAKPGDRINIAGGQYAEDVVVNKPLALIGAGSGSTIINAKGLANGIYVDGLDNAGMTNVLITGLTVLNANFEGILVTNTSYIVISNSHVASNDQSLNYAAATCAGQPVFETNEGDDCGEGIHLIGVDHATISNNEMDLNAGGILLSDETGMTHDNLITANSVHDNALDCGVTLASHGPSPQAPSKLPYGVFNNNIVGNSVARNGLVGAGAGVGIFAAGPGNLTFGNKVIGNTITDNGLPGVTVHNHALVPGAPGINLNDTLIVGNLISGNAADTEDAATPGTAGINLYGVGAYYGTIIEQNTIVNEDLAVVMSNPGMAEVHMNNLIAGKGVVNLGTGVVNASMNFFGCAGGPGTTGCGTVSGPLVSAAPWLSAPVGSAPGTGSGKGRP